MIEPILLTLFFLLAKARTAPDRDDVRARLARSRDAGTIYFVLRAALPSAGFSCGAIVSGATAIMTLSGAPADPDIRAILILMIGTLFMGLLARISMNTAEALVSSEAGTPDASARDGLLFELVCFPLIPYLTAIGLVSLI